MEIKRCPFCGGEAELAEHNGLYGVQCKRIETCGAVVFFEDKREYLMQTYFAWQRRRSKENIEGEKIRINIPIAVDPSIKPSMLKQLRSCPFCGGLMKRFVEAYNKDDKPFGAIVCDKCQAWVMFQSADDKQSMEEVSDRWNRRDGE